MCTFQDNFFINSEETHLLLISELTGNSIKIDYNKYNKKMLISCFNKIIKDIENLSEFNESIFTGQISIDNLDVIYNYFPEDKEFADKVIEFVNNRDIDRYTDFISDEEDNGRLFNTKEFDILFKIKLLMK